MQYSPYFNGYQSGYYQMPVSDQLTQLKQYQAPSSSIIWVQGEAAARAYMVAAGNSVLLMDSDESVFYLKSTDSSGMPQPMRIFDYTERTQNSAARTEITESNFVTRQEFEALSRRFDALIKEEENGKSDI